MKTLIAFLTGLFLLGVAQATAAENDPPWTEALATLAAIEGDLLRGGIQALGQHAENLEALIAEGRQSTGTYDTGNHVLVLTDGPAETMMAMTAVTAAQSQRDNPRQVAAVPNPYPPIALYLGSYYNEIGRHADALRVLEAGIALPRVVVGSQAGAHLPLLTTERGAAFLGSMQWANALAAYDEGLTLPNLSPNDHARLLRGRGFALIELGRLEEAAQAYRDSLESEPDNPLALRELNYIEGLRTGGQAAPPQVFAPGQQQ